MNNINIKIDSEPCTRNLYITQMKELFDDVILTEVPDNELKISCDTFIHSIRSDILRRRWISKYPYEYPNSLNEKEWLDHCKKTREDLDKTVLKEINSVK